MNVLFSVAQVPEITVPVDVFRVMVYAAIASVVIGGVGLLTLLLLDLVRGKIW